MVAVTPLNASVVLRSSHSSPSTAGLLTPITQRVARRVAHHLSSVNITSSSIAGSGLWYIVPSPVASIDFLSLIGFVIYLISSHVLSVDVAEMCCGVAHVAQLIASRFYHASADVLLYYGHSLRRR